ncbi:MAG: sugar ABC transporter ATP-binding protein [Fibrobacter sp.]|nr:sugar ABC transporter ATP-binding protein [Fibrobacter sp.]
MKQELCRLVNVSVSDKNETFLQQINLYLLKHERLAIVGLHGSGKSVLAHTIAGLRPCSSGNIIWNGIDREHIYSIKHQPGCFYINAASMLVPSLSIADNVVSLGEHKPGLLYNQKVACEITNEIFNRLDIQINPRTSISQLTMFEALIVQIAKAIYNRSELVIVDSSRQPLVIEELSVLKRVIEVCSDQAFIYISNADDLVSQYCDRVVVMQSGRISGVLYKDNYDSEELTRYITGYYNENRFTQQRAKKTLYPSHPVLEISNANRICPTIKHQLDITVNVGEIVGIINTSTYVGDDFLRAIEHRNYQGIIKINNKPVANYREAVKAGLGLIHMSNPKSQLFRCFDGEENLTFLTLKRISNWGFVDKQIRNFIFSFFYDKIFRSKFSDSKVWYQIQMIFYRWVSNNPKVLVLDLILTGLHPICQKEFINMLLEQVDEGVGILILSNSLTECYDICDRIYILNQGSTTPQVESRCSERRNLI